MDRSISCFFPLCFFILSMGNFARAETGVISFDLLAIEKPRILTKANAYLLEKPRTVTADLCERSQGDAHDFFSEGDYWWPNPEDPDGPYIRRDGETNPANFIAHRKSMIRLSEMIGTLVSAFLITKEKKYAQKAMDHLRAWFVESKTRMRPSLLYGQAIKGRHSGRSIGIIDTLHLVEVARGAKILCASPSLRLVDQKAIKSWFGEYLDWMNSHEYGLKEKLHPNNHGVCWSLQAAAFADLVGDQKMLQWVRQQFRTTYLGGMMDEKGGFPAELKRTKPYGYSLFILDAMAGIAQIASNQSENLWKFSTPNGRSMKLGMSFIFPFVQDKGKWPWKPDVMYWEEWPVRHPSLLFAGIRLEKEDYLQAWQKFEADPITFEILRNLPLRHPLLWVAPTGA